MIRIAVCDWNRTLFEDPYDSAFFFGLMRKSAFDRFRAVNLKRLFGLLKTHYECESLLKRCLRLEATDSQARAELVSAIVEILNRHIIQGIPARLLDAYLDEYALRAATRLDQRLLGPLTRLHRDFGLTVVVLSSGCQSGIERTLTKVGFPFESVIANSFEREGDCLTRFKITVYGNKGAILKDLLQEKRVDLGEAAFIGDDWEDRDCFEMVGLPVVSFFASQENKALLAKTCHAFVPKTEVDVEKLLCPREAVSRVH